MTNIFAVIRTMRTHTEVKALYWKEQDAQKAVDRLNEVFPRGARHTVTPMCVHSDISVD